MTRVNRLLVMILLMAVASCQRQARPLSVRKVGPRHLIIHADDAGMCNSVNQATIRAMESGLVSSASIMVPCRGFESFAKYAADHPEKDFGVHLVLNSEWDTYRWGPITPRERVPSLVDEDGFFWKTGELVVVNVKAEEAEIELRAQIARARQHNIRIGHLDSHMFALFERPDLVKLYLKLAVEYKLPILIPRLPDKAQAKRYPHLGQMHAHLIRTLKQHKLPVVDYVDTRSYGVSMGRKRRHYMRYVRRMEPGIGQLIVHCGMNDAELNEITPGARQRYADFRVFTSQSMVRELNSLDIEITDWKKLHKLARLGANVAKAGQSQTGGADGVLQ